MERSPRSRFSCAALAFAALVTFAIVGCKKEPVVTKPVEDKQVPPPAGLFLEAALPKLKGGAAGVGAYADKLQPGVGGMLDLQLGNLIGMATGAPSLDGAKPDAPVRLLVMDPKKGKHVAALVAVADEKKLRESAKSVTIHVKSGHALVGDKDAVEALDGYAFGTLAKRPAPEAPGALVYAPQLLASYGADIEEAFAQLEKTFEGPGGQASMGKIMKLYKDGILGLLERSETIELRIDASAETASLDLAFVPKAGNEMAAFIAAQKPATGKLLERLPAMTTPPALIMDANLALGPLRDKLRPLLADAIASFAGVAVDDKVRAAIDSWLDQFVGEFVAAGDVGGANGMRMTQLGRVVDAGKAMEATRIFLTAMVGPTGKRTSEMMGIKMTVSGKLDAGSHDGVAFMSYDVKPDFSNLPPEIAATQKGVYGADGTLHTMFGGFDDLLVITMGADPAASMPALVDAARGKGSRLELPESTSKLLADSRARGESFVYVFDIASLMRGAMAAAQGLPEPTDKVAAAAVVMALGFKDGKAHLRIALPSESLVAIKNMQAGAAGGMPPQ
jgi:hypothetical protein